MSGKPRRDRRRSLNVQQAGSIVDALARRGWENAHVRPSARRFGVKSAPRDGTPSEAQTKKNTHIVTQKQGDVNGST